MKTIWENGEDDGSSGGSRTSALQSETNLRSGEGGGENHNASPFKVIGVTNSMRIIQEDDCNSSSSSSIGDNSDDDREEDVESRYSYDHQNDNGSFDDAIQALEQALPIRRGISTFYNGKSKSFTSLTDMWPTTLSSVKDITKPENAYTRRQRNRGAFKKLSNINTGRICKKPKTTILHFSLDTDDDHPKQTQINRPLPPLRSFSMINLHPPCCNSTKIGNC